MTALLLEIAYTDWKMKRIQDRNILLLMILGMAAIWIIPEISFIQRLTGFVIISIPLLILAYLVPGSIGGGDIKLMAAGGFLLGIAGIWSTFVIGMFSAGAYVVYLLILKKINRKAEIALGPFLCMGMGIAFWG